MNAFQECQNTSDLVPLYLPQELYLKPIARLNISIALPNIRKSGKSISHLEIMDKVRNLIKPEEFTVLKVTKTTVEVIRFEAEVSLKSKLPKIVEKLDGKRIKLKDFPESLKVKSAEAKSEFPSQKDWDSFFQEAKDMDEMKHGERPDTIHLWNLPTKWFVPHHLSGESDITPSEKILYRIFEKFGTIRYVDIPICDPYRKKMKEGLSGFKHTDFKSNEFYEGYVQFKDYVGFSKAMAAIKDMKWVKKEDDNTAVEVNVKVNFDRHKHLSDASVRRREIVRDRLVRKVREKEELEKKELEDKKKKEQVERLKEQDLKTQKELRRKLREEKRKAKVLEKLEVSGSEEVNDKIAREEKKLLKVQRKLEAIRLVEELFRRIKEKHIDTLENFSNVGVEELKRYKNTSELNFLTQREKVHNALKSRVMLKTILAKSKKKKNYSSSSSESEFSLDDEPKSKNDKIITKPLSPPLELLDPSWYGFPFPIHPGALYAKTGYVSKTRGFRYGAGPSRGRGRFRGGFRGRSRRYPPDVEIEYQKYFSKFLPEDRSRSRSRSRSRHRGRSHSRSRSRSRKRSYSRSRSRRRSRRRDRRSSSRSRSRSRRRKSRSRSRSWSMPRESDKRTRSWSKSS